MHRPFHQVFEHYVLQVQIAMNEITIWYACIRSMIVNWYFIPPDVNDDRPERDQIGCIVSLRGTQSSTPDWEICHLVHVYASSLSLLCRPILESEQF